ncbi:electron transfer flavoprotein subunit alpha/FixB family protein [Syntrophomonas palmitatica]|uniref:electron transfer flavoprotein subunit alpha/FixB family protein n=1 Tax=Syntrophomonas palmitatica TaxID=402877 RepID=UPI0006D1C910|nr:electron transfer flavoprotein subunit alpha/FixB family protein [Syntrophomonas palmitatica]
MAAILIYSDKDKLALELVNGAKSLGASSIKAVSINNESQAATLAGAGAEAFSIKNEAISVVDVSAMASALAQAAVKLGADTVLLSSDRRGKELAGRLAQVMEAGCLTDISAINVNGDIIECQRNALGGATVATQYVASAKKVLAVRPKTFEAAAAGQGQASSLEVEVKTSAVKLVEVKQKGGDTVDIEAAEVLVAVGQGLNSQDDLPMVEELARKLGGEVACSKPVATDKKWLSEERVIGLSGKKCKPQLALLFGISGQVQFTVGIRDAKVIAAVNSDENAAINQMADYILTADLHDVIKDMNKTVG